MWPDDPDPYWRALELLVMSGAAVVIVIAAIGLVYSFLADYHDRDNSPGNLPIERLRNLPTKPK